jgi:hypothetical protein
MKSYTSDVDSLRRRIKDKPDGHLLQIRVGVIARLLEDLDAVEWRSQEEINAFVQEVRELRRGVELNQNAPADVIDHGPVWTEQTYRDMAVEDGLLPAPSLTETDEQELQREMDGTFPGSWQRAAQDVVRQNTRAGSVYEYMDAPALQDADGRYPNDPHYS